MKKNAFLLILLFILLCACGRRSSPTIVTVSSDFPKLHLEFVSNPLYDTLDHASTGLRGPAIVVGDVTGNGYPEVLLTRGGWVPTTCEDEPAALFYGHPVTFSWNGETFEQLQANWIGITSYSDARSVCHVQGVPEALLITDLNGDGINEVIVGTMPYRDASHQGAVYVFQWDGEQFVARLSDYCMGAAVRLDSVNLGAENMALVSATMLIGFGFDIQVNIDACPHLQNKLEEIDTGLYLLRAVNAHEYESQPWCLDHASRSALVTISNSTSEIQVIRAISGSSDQPAIIDWSTARTIWYDGQVHTTTTQIEIAIPVLHIEGADLDGDGNPEIIVLGREEGNSNRLTDRERSSWQVFKSTERGYDLIYEGNLAATADGDSALPLFFAVGDIDRDGQAEIIDNSGIIYKWVDNRLHPLVNLTEVLGERFARGLESIYIGDVYGDGHNRVIFTGRCSDPEEKECDFPRMYIVGVAIQHIVE